MMDKQQNVIRILFIGNSYTSRNDLPGLLTSMAASCGTPLDAEAIVAGGASLRRHWNHGEAISAIRGTRWDYVVLQEQSTLPAKNARRYHDNVRIFEQEIRQRGARTALYLTWARKNAVTAQHAIDEAVMTIAREVGALVLPVGPAWQAAQRDCAPLALYAADGSHPTLAGTYLAACVMFTVLFKRDPPPLDRTLSLSERDARCLRSIASRFT